MSYISNKTIADKLIFWVSFAGFLAMWLILPSYLELDDHAIERDKYEKIIVSCLNHQPIKIDGKYYLCVTEKL